MSIDTQVAIVSWLACTLIVFLVAALLLDSDGTRDKDRVWIGRIGLAAPLWPIMIVAAVIVVLFLMGRELFRAARGRT